MDIIIKKSQYDNLTKNKDVSLVSEEKHDYKSNEARKVIESALEEFKNKNPDAIFEYKIDSERYGYPVVDFEIVGFRNGSLDSEKYYDAISDLSKFFFKYLPGSNNSVVEFHTEYKISDKVYQKFLQSDYIKSLKDFTDEFKIDNLKYYFSDFDGVKSNSLDKTIERILQEKVYPIESRIKEFIQSKTDVPLKFDYRINQLKNDVKLKVLPQLTLQDFLNCKYKRWDFDSAPLYLTNVTPLPTQLNSELSKSYENFQPIGFEYEIVWPREIGNYITKQNEKIRNKLSQKILEKVSVVVNYNICGQTPEFIIGYPTQPGDDWGELRKYIEKVLVKLRQVFPDIKGYKTSNRYWDVKKMFTPENQNYWSREKLFEFFKNNAVKNFGDIYEYDLDKFIDLDSDVEVFCKKHQVWFKVNPRKHLKGKKCPMDVESSGEKLVRVYLENMGVKFIMYHRIKECFSMINKRCYTLPFDFYLPDYNLLIEYDGEQHFKPVDIWGGEQGFARQQILDGIKNKFASDHKIKLIRVPYTVKKTEQLEKYLPKEMFLD